MTDPSPVVGGHGPHDDQPHWTVDELVGVGDSLTLWWFFGVGEALEPWEALNPQPENDQFGPSYDALVRAVRDAAEVSALRTHATTLAAIKTELATYEDVLDDPYDCQRFTRFVADLLMGETDGE